MDPVNVPTNSKYVALPVPEIIASTWKLWAVPGYAVQGHPFWYQSKARMRLSLSVIVTLVLSCTVSEILQVFCAPGWPHPYSALILGMFPLYQITHVGVSPNRNLKVFGREIIFQKFQPMWSRYLNITDRQTTFCGITALCVASRGKNAIFIILWLLAAVPKKCSPGSYAGRLFLFNGAVLRTPRKGGFGPVDVWPGAFKPGWVC